MGSSLLVGERSVSRCSQNHSKNAGIPHTGGQGGSSSITDVRQLSPLVFIRFSRKQDTGHQPPGAHGNTISEYRAPHIYQQKWLMQRAYFSGNVIVFETIEVLRDALFKVPVVCFRRA